jgi:hypothetical protein
MSSKNVFRIIFLNQGKVYEIFAESVNQGGLFGFVEVEGLLFGEKSSVVVDPAEERLKSEFEGVKRLHIPMQVIMRIDEMEQRGSAKITELSGQDKVTPFPGPMVTPPHGPEK